MKILALEFSSPRRSVAILESKAEAPPAEGIAREGESGPAGALGLVETALRAAGLEREQVECIAVGLGPGSYAGIRGAISLAQGWQLARGVNVVGVSSVECLATQAQAGGLRGRVHVVIDAQRSEFYLAGYEISAEKCHAAESLRLATLAEVEALAGAGGTLIGPEVTRWFPGGSVLLPDAATLGRLAARRTDFVSAEALAPIYLRETSFVKAPPPKTFLS